MGERIELILPDPHDTSARDAQWRPTEAQDWNRLEVGAVLGDTAEDDHVTLGTETITNLDVMWSVGLQLLAAHQWLVEQRRLQAQSPATKLAVVAAILQAHPHLGASFFAAQPWSEAVVEVELTHTDTDEGGRVAAMVAWAQALPGSGVTAVLRLEDRARLRMAAEVDHVVVHVHVSVSTPELMAAVAGLDHGDPVGLDLLRRAVAEGGVTDGE